MNAVDSTIAETDTADAAAATPGRSARRVRWFWLGAALLGLAVFLATGLAMQGDLGAIAAFDRAVAGWMRALRTPASTVVAIDLTALGSTAVVTLVTVTCAVLFALRKDWRAIAHVAIASAGAGVCSKTFKHFFERVRPGDAPPLVQAMGYSFPSGHTLVATALYLTLAVLAFRVFRRTRERTAVFTIAAVVVGLVGATRVYLGVHFPSDVVGGAAVGAAWAFVLAALLGDVPGRATPERPRP